MFEITKPAAFSSNTRSTLKAGSKPPKGESGVIRGRPSTLNFNLSTRISNAGNEYQVENVQVILTSLIPIEGPELILATNTQTLGTIEANGTADATFSLSLTNPELIPVPGNLYQVQGLINFTQENLEGPQTHSLLLEDIEVVFIE